MTKNSGNIAEVVKRLERRSRSDEQARASWLRVKNFIASAERHDGEGVEIGGTGHTVLKFEQSPIARLCNSGNLGNEEMRAVDDINAAFHAIAGGMMIKPQELEKHDRSHSEHNPAKLVAAERRYREWSRHWSARARRGDPTLQIVFAAVIDERPLYLIDADCEIRRGKSRVALIAGLRDYAARAGWVEPRLSAQWIDAAEGVFVLRGAIS